MGGIYAGLRIKAQALTLKWENVDLNRRLITIEAVYSKNREALTIPIHSKLFAVLLQLWSNRKGEYVFAKPNGEALRSVRSVRSVRTAFTKACQRARLSGVTPHTLRHTCASRLAMGGVNDVALQALGRWKEPKMIRRYAHLSQDHLAHSIEKIGSRSPTLITTPNAPLS
jgi:integrase